MGWELGPRAPVWDGAGEDWGYPRHRDQEVQLPGHRAWVAGRMELANSWQHQLTGPLWHPAVVPVGPAWGWHLWLRARAWHVQVVESRAWHCPHAPGAILCLG